MKYKYNNQWKDLNVKVSDTYPIGAIAPYGGETAPTNWLICDGSVVSRTTYADLFSVIGTSFGPGDGSTTFNLPDLRSRIPLGVDSRDEDFDTIGKTYGEKEHTLTVDEIPAHTHTIYRAGGTFERFNLNPTWSNAMEQSASAGSAIGATGGSEPHNIVQPSVVTNYIIKAFQSAGIVGNVAKTYTESDTDTYNCKYINTLHTYSIDETVVGTYGGKPLYRKIYETTMTIPGGGGFTSITIPHDLSNVDKIWVDNSVSRIEATGSSYVSYSLPLIGYEGNTTDKIYAKVDRTNILVYGQGWGTDWRKVIGVLYTKTTD